MIESIMIVDDEPQILRAFHRVFTGGKFTVHYRESGQEVLDYLENHKVDLLITDIRMPGMDGIKLLRLVKEKYPRMLRIVLSGYTDMKIVFHALEENLAKTYWVKPWSNDEFLQSIQKLSEIEDLFNREALLEFFNNMQDLPTLPEMYLSISRLIREDADVDKIAKVIEKDLSIASRILRIANSAFYGTHTGSIRQAIMFIGLSNMKNLILSHSVFENTTVQRGVFQHLWAHANRTNIITSMIYTEFLGRKIPQIYASAGLLHSIGLIVLWMRNGAKYLDVIAQEGGEGAQVSHIERDTFKVTHEELGAYLLNWWDLPLPIVEAALYHHRPSDDMIINKELVGVIHIAHYYAWESIGESLFKEPLDESIFDNLGFSKEAFELQFKHLDFS